MQNQYPKNSSKEFQVRNILGVILGVMAAIFIMMASREDGKSLNQIKRLRPWRLALARQGIYTIEDLSQRVSKEGLDSFLNYPGIGEIGIKKIRVVLQYYCPNKNTD